MALKFYKAMQFSSYRSKQHFALSLNGGYIVSEQDKTLDATLHCTVPVFSICDPTQANEAL